MFGIKMSKSVFSFSFSNNKKVEKEARKMDCFTSKGVL